MKEEEKKEGKEGKGDERGKEGGRAERRIVLQVQVLSVTFFSIPI